MFIISSFFLIYAEMMRWKNKRGEKGVRVEGELLAGVSSNLINFADDQGIVAQAEKGFQKIMDA